MHGIEQSEQATLRMKEIQPRVPSWAKAERLKITTSQAELWKYADDSKWKPHIRILDLLAGSKSKRR